jgi:hypothetical protein
MSISANPLLATEYSLWTNHQNNDQNQQRWCIFELCWNDKRSELNKQTNKETAN